MFDVKTDHDDLNERRDNDDEDEDEDESEWDEMTLSDASSDQE
jgi:hypothetical protein